MRCAICLPCAFTDLSNWLDVRSHTGLLGESWCKQPTEISYILGCPHRIVHIIAVVMHHVSATAVKDGHLHYVIVLPHIKDLSHTGDLLTEVKIMHDLRLAQLAMLSRAHWAIPHNEG